MDFDPNMEPMELLVYEDTTLLNQLDQILLDSEKSKDLSHENINEIFRIMHTIKGSAAMMGLNGISTLAHAVEDVFAIIRETPEALAGVAEQIFDLVFQASDFLKSEIESLQNTGEANEDPAEAVAELHALAAVLKSGEQPAAAAPAASAAPAAAPAPEAGPAEEGMYHIRVFFEDGCELENVRAFVLMTQLKGLCDELDSDPPHPETDSSLCAGIRANGFLIKCRPSDSIDEICSTIESSVNVDHYEVLTSEKEEEPAPAPQPEAPAPAAAAQPAKPKPAAQPAAASAPAPAPAAARPMQSLISVNQAKLDHLMDLVGEIVTTESMVVNSPDLRGLKLDNYNKSARELRKLTDELQDVVMSMRMVPLTGVFQKMNRIVRDMCKKLGKKAELVTVGGETEVDKTINEVLGDPFMHMVRNSMDHAIEMPEERVAAGKPETGTITLSAQNVGGEIVISIADDGCGLNRESILRKAANNGLLMKAEEEYSDREVYSMIMLPGFSTNKEVTEFSGRGVGMDVVQKNLEKVGGSISIDSIPGKGTTFTIKIPLTLAIVDGMELAVGNTLFTLPISSIKENFKLSDSTQLVQDTNGAEMVLIRGECLPIIRLHELYNLETKVTDLAEGILILISSGRKSACLFVDELIGEQQVVVKPFPAFFNKYPLKQIGLSGCSILGDGFISLILDSGNLLAKYN
ncbi:MAG: chemotaxis protein CheA [Subdoligranulum sp.]|nr:chemotaxis protein CheA [Subdoligranulum sp.]